MAQIPDVINQIIRTYLAALRTAHIPIQHAFLFGSYAKGTYNEWSDIDLAVISDAFEGRRIDDRHKLLPVTISVSTLLEVLPYRPEDFTSADPFVREILKTGLQIV